MSLRDLPRPFFVLAPMDDVTDTVFRRMVAGCAPPDLYFTEFVNVDGLQSPGRPRLLKKLRFTDVERPLIAQIWGLNPDNFHKTAQQLADGTFAAELGLPQDVNFAGVDINMGCPDKTVVKNGTCSALINNQPLAKEIIAASREGLGGKLPLSVKTRLGFSQVSPEWIEFLLNQKLDMLTVHARTRSEMSKVPAHWEQFGVVCELRDKLAPDTLIVGNGDILTRKQGLELATQYRLDGLMIGRGIFHDPYVFAEDSPWQTVTPEQRIDLYRSHVECFKQTWQQNERPVHTLNKFCKIYINGFEGAKELREDLMLSFTPSELLAKLNAAQPTLA